MLCSVMPERHQPAQHCVDVGSRKQESRMKVPDTINGFEVHKPLDALLEEPNPYFAPPPRLVATDIINDPILNALADNFQGIRDAEQLRVNQQQLNVAGVAGSRQSRHQPGDAGEAAESRERAAW